MVTDTNVAAQQPQRRKSPAYNGLPDLSSLTVCEPVVAKKGTGIRIAPILLDKQPFTLTIGKPAAPLRVPFAVAPFSKEDASTRLNLNLEILCAELQDVSRSWMTGCWKS